MSQIQEWYYAEGNSSVGPVNQAEFDALVANGTVRADTLVWQEGMADWLPLSQMAGMGGAPNSPPLPEKRTFTASAARADASTFLGALKDGFARYVDFGTRSNRPQFWWWSLWTIILGFVTGLIDGVVGMGEFGIFNTILNLAVFLPSIAVAVRRLHDIGRSGWWYLMILIPIVGWIVLLVFFCTRSQEETNQWGGVPR